MRLWIIALCATALQFSALVEASPLGPTFGGGFSPRRQVSEPSANFADGIRDWFRNVKNRVFGGGESQALPPPEAARLIMELENENPQERRRNHPGGFFLDLSGVTFDPEKDWGFRLGQWYIIRKSNEPSTNVDWNSASYPDWPDMDEGKVDEPPPPFVIVKSNEITTRFPSPIPDQESREGTDIASEEPKDSDNETRSDSENMRSTEVLIAS